MGRLSNNASTLYPCRPFQIHAFAHGFARQMAPRGMTGGAAVGVKTHYRTILGAD